jgi:hypothetical protein
MSNAPTPEDLRIYYALLAAGLVLALAASVAVFAVGRRRRGGGAVAAPGTDALAGAPDAAAARRLLAYAFGTLWLVDGLLQAQPALSTELVPGVILPLTQHQPAFLFYLMNAALAAWAPHPLFWNAAAVWGQLVIGALLLWGPDRRPGRLGALLAVAWGLCVWVVGEGMGQIWAGTSWLVGAPGSVAFYVFAAVLLLEPAAAWADGRVARLMGRSFAVLWAGLLALQAWPAAGFWRTDALAAAVAGMLDMPQPHPLAAPIAAFARSLAHAPGAWNAVLVAALAFLAVAWWRVPDRPWLWLVTVAAQIAAWWLGQDFGILGGTGTDPNSAVPICLIVAVYARLRRAGVRDARPVARAVWADGR